MFTKTCSLAAVLLLAAVGTAWAQVNTERDTLKGLKTVSVVVEKPSPEAERDGITKSQLQTDVELRLRLAGIHVETVLSSAYVYVRVSALKSPSGYAYDVEVEFQQAVTLVRTGDLAIGSTWSEGTIGITPLLGASQAVREAVRDQVDKFINAFLSVNPKQ